MSLIVGSIVLRFRGGDRYSGVVDCSEPPAVALFSSLLSDRKAFRGRSSYTVSNPNSTTDDDSAAANPEPSGVKSNRPAVPWSDQLALRFGIDFDNELRFWWDEMSGSAPRGPGEFRFAVSPQTLLSSVPDPIWPPLMPPNFLPLIGNGAGDWLCLRLLDPEVAGRKGVSTDVCHWYHGGGDWLPWGGKLAEALFFDWALPRLPQSDRRHAEPAIDSDARDEALSQEKRRDSDDRLRDCLDHPWGRWVGERLPAAVELGRAETADPHRLAQEMLDRGLCEIPVRCQLVIDALSNELLGRIDANASQELGLVWNDWMRWCFDLRTMPGAIAGRLRSALDLPASYFDPEQQRWDEVARHAGAVSRSHSELAWGHDLLGYVGSSAGDDAAAEVAFANAIRCSVFTDQSVRLRTHWATSSDGVAKFSAKFLNKNSMADANVLGERELAAVSLAADQLGRIPAAIPQSRLLDFFGRCPGDGSSSVRQRYSQMLVEESGQAHPAATRARLLYAAGWDLGAEPLRRYGELLDQYIAACRDAGWASHQQLASVHRHGLKARYNL